MKLYDKTEKTIEVYTMQPNVERLRDFKKAEMQQISFEERVIRASTNGDKPLANINGPIFLNTLEKSGSGLWGGSDFHLLETYEMTDDEKIRQLELLNNYYNSAFNSKPIVQIKDFNNKTKKWQIIRYLLLTKSYLIDMNQLDTYTMDDIISVPKSLYLSQLLEQGQFSKVVDEDIEEQLLNFDISPQPIQRFYINQLKRMYDAGLIPGTFEGVMMNVETTSKILKKIK